jgi:hypothetical protein
MAAVSAKASDMVGRRTPIGPQPRSPLTFNGLQCFSASLAEHGSGDNLTMSSLLSGRIGREQRQDLIDDTADIVNVDLMPSGQLNLS